MSPPGTIRCSAVELLPRLFRYRGAGAGRVAGGRGLPTMRPPPMRSIAVDVLVAYGAVGIIGKCAPAHCASQECYRELDAGLSRQRGGDHRSRSH
ncbi:hypothetical protein HBB16_19820 [Pseudonocardia sp. MCCB 268]|nr:hypothetical protein [Pseudonocardia cytotoxica]